MPWSWGFSTFYFCLAAALESARRLWPRPLPEWVPPVVGAIAVNIENHLFRRETVSLSAFANICAALVLSMVLGTVTAILLLRDRSNAPLQPATRR
jgi:hypothetical protein